MDRKRLLLLALLLAWLGYEAFMAVLLRESMARRDWVALSYKLGYLIVSAWGVYKGKPLVACVVAPSYAGAVRAAGGWLSYTWFTVMAPLLGALVCASCNNRAGALANAAFAAIMAITMAGRVYTAPTSLGLDMVAGLLLGITLSLAMDRRSLYLIWPALLVAITWPSLL